MATCPATNKKNDPPLQCSQDSNHSRSQHWDDENGQAFNPEDAD